MSILPCMLPLRPILVMLLTICCSMGVGSLCRAADANHCCKRASAPSTNG